jgi:nucleoid DNA-binding protein
MAKNKQEIIYFLANKYDLPLKEVDEIINHQFKFVARIIKKGNFDTIRLPYFGKFIVNKNRLKHINEKTNKKNSEKI